MIGGLARTIGRLFLPPRKPARKVREDGTSVPSSDFSIGPLERTLILRMLGSEPFIEKRIVQAVQLGIRDPLKIAMPATLPADFRREKWYVEIDHASDVHRLVVSFTGPRDLFSYCQAFVTLGDLPETARLGVLADGPAIAKGERRLSHYVDMTALGHDPRVISVHADAMGRVVLMLEKYEDLMPWPEFEAEILRIHDETRRSAQNN
jgi:hypothetical protein